MNCLFDSAGLAIVAYAEVVGSSGASTSTNSGVTTARVVAGQYTVTLPADKAQYPARDLIFVQVKGTGTGPVAAKVDDTDPAIKTVRTSDATTLVDADFSILILRTIVPPPAGAPA
jgi:hypothetical protein